MNARMHRRTILKGAAAIGATGLLGGAADAAPAPLHQFGYGDVDLLEGPARAQFDATHATLLAMDEDALLKPYRQRAGLAAPGPDLGGWYNFSDGFVPGTNMTGFIPGHSLGQYISSLARAYAVTGSAASAAKVRRLVDGLGPALVTQFYQGYPLPAYTYDKIVVGLVDAQAYGGHPTALSLLGKATDAAAPWLPGRALTRAEMRAKPHPNEAYTWDEPYTLPENLYRAAALGAGERYHAMARAYLHDRFYFDPLAAGENKLPGQHAYSHVNALASAMQAYFTDGSEKHLRAARNGMDFVLAQSFATGGWGPSEGFVKPGEGALGKSLAKNASFETPCGTYGHFKVARYLMRATRESRWGDAMERLLYNAALGVLPLKANGTAFYYSDYGEASTKHYYDQKCPCCSGTIGQLAADYGISSYLHDAGGIYVNLYLPSRVRWHNGRSAVTLTQHTSYPLVPTTEIRVATPRPARFAIRLRIPAWAGPGTAVSVNGRRQPIPLVPGTFAEIRREWRDGDRIALAFGMTRRLEPVDAETPDRVALMHGPLALFQTGDNLAALSRADLLAARQDGPGAASWSAAGKRFRPFFAIGSEKMRLYQFLTQS